MTYTEINGESFESCKGGTDMIRWDNGFYDRYGADPSEISHVYGRPSARKVAIWERWCRWCQEINRSGGEAHIEIASHNSNFFTIRGWVLDETACEINDIYITAAHNRVYDR